ncbi:hypothetical protein [Pedobacter suwonensis]|uniref:hypothetical protein n=1 Tax=Pedobacter suwonensis TaxID=332999 RepID=UPI0036A252F9
MKYKVLLLIAILSNAYIQVRSQITYDRYLIKGVGYISIPETMEIQSGEYKKIEEKYQNDLKQTFKFQITDNRIVFQQKGLNKLDKESFNTYARVILETYLGTPGEYEKLTTTVTATSSELLELDKQLKSQIIESFKNTGLKLVNWNRVQIVTINGGSVLKISYTRQLRNNPLVNVSMYQFHNNDRMHMLTFSYRKEDAVDWSQKLNVVLKSFKITNIR